MAGCRRLAMAVAVAVLIDTVVVEGEAVDRMDSHLGSGNRPGNWLVVA